MANAPKLDLLDHQDIMIGACLRLGQPRAISASHSGFQLRVCRVPVTLSSLPVDPTHVGLHGDAARRTAGFVEKIHMHEPILLDVTKPSSLFIENNVPARTKGAS